MKALHNTGFKFNAFCICAALITYTSMYAFRKPLSAATFEGIVYWGVDYKVIALISQVIGYTCSKFLGIKIVSGMKPTQRTAYILSLVGIAWGIIAPICTRPCANEHHIPSYQWLAPRHDIRNRHLFS